MVSKIVVCGTRECYIVDVVNMKTHYAYTIWKHGEIIDDGAIDPDLSMMFSELAKIVERLETEEDG